VKIIDALKRYKVEMSRSKNTSGIRCIWIWNMDVSGKWGGNSGHLISRMGRYMAAPSERWPELSILNTLLATETDVVIQEDSGYSSDLIEYWQGIGVDCSQRIILDSSYDHALLSKKREAMISNLLLENSYLDEKVMLACFGNSNVEEDIARRNNMLLFGGDAQSSLLCNNKVVIRQWCKELGIKVPQGEVCNSSADVRKAAKRLFLYFNRIVIKEPYGISGKGMIILDNSKKVERICNALDAAENMANGQKISLIVEGWYEKCISHNSQFIVLPSGELYFLQQTEQILREQRYEGNYFRSRANSPNTEEILKQQIAISQKAYENGYHGILGIDSFETFDNSIFPVLEINARINMSTFVLAILERIDYFNDACAMTYTCLLYTSPSPRDRTRSRMPSSA